MTEEQIRDAAASAYVSVGGSAFIHGVDSDLDQFKEELASMIEYLKANA